MRCGIWLLIIAAVIPSTAWAQSIPVPRDFKVDDNRVDLYSGKVIFSTQDVNIGPQDGSGLKYETIYTPNGFMSNLKGVYRTEFHCNPVDCVNTESFHLGMVREDILSSNVYSDQFVSGRGWNRGGQGIFVSGDGTIMNFSQFEYYNPLTCDTYPPEPDKCPTRSESSSYLIKYIEYPNGIRWTFYYKPDGFYNPSYYRLQSVTSNTGYQIKLSYQSNVVTSAAVSLNSWRTLSSVTAINNSVDYCDPIADTCALTQPWPVATYTYTGSSRIITNSSGEVTRITPTVNPYQLKVKTPSSSIDNIVYAFTQMQDPCPEFPNSWGPCSGGFSYALGEFGPIPYAVSEPRVTSVNINGEQTTYSYDLNLSGPRKVTSVNALGDATVYTGNFSKKDPLGRTTALAYDTPYHRLVGATFPEGNAVVYEIDNGATGVAGERGNITKTTYNPKPGTVGAITESKEFPSSTFVNGVQIYTAKTFNKPITSTDARGGVTNYTYDNAHGGLLTETLPPDANGIRPVKRYGYAARYAWIKNASGTYVQASTPVWLLMEERTCRTSATVGGGCSAGPSDELVTTFGYGLDSGPNNLLLREKVQTSEGNTLRTCYAYDIYGRKISETTARAGLTSCP